MSRCKNCGARVMWARRPEGQGFLPPLDFPSEVKVEVKWDSVSGDFIGIPNMESFNTTFHDCDQFQVYKPYDLSADSSPINPNEIDPENAPDALDKECPTCGAEPREWCHTVKDYNKAAAQLHRTRLR